MASDGGRPTVWIELGGAFAQLENSEEAYLPSFVAGTSRLSFITEPPAAIEKPASTSWDGNAKLRFQPAGSSWMFSIAARYGRNKADRSLDQRTAERTPTNYYFVEHNAYQNLSAKTVDSHLILDFSVGKDVGLGMFGQGGKSVINAGIRYAQLETHTNVGIQYQPTNVNPLYYPFHRFYGSFDANRRFIGLGPSLSWDASASLFGNSSDGEISFDWGVNGALLIGRQQTQGHHRTTNVRLTYASALNKHTVYQSSASPNRSKEVVVPNLGGFASVSWRYPNAKVSFGYRADMFFGAIDGGIDAAKKEKRGFYGPFVSMSIGVGNSP